jgi:uncharacterized protein YbaP (TraB family)
MYSCKSTKAPSVENTTFDNSLLWKIEGNGLSKASYLFGTIHMIDKESFYWPQGTLTALDAAEKVVFEIDLDDMFDMSKAMGLMNKAFMNDGKTLKDFYNEEDYSLVKAHFEDMGIPFFMMQKMKPMFLTVFASGDIKPGEGLNGDGDIKSYEMELYSIAQESKKDVSGLETIDYQISVFDSIPYQEQADMLLQTIKSSDTEDDSFKQMIEMYTSQDINAMISSMSDEEGIAGNEDVLLYNRNRNWIPIMADKMKSNSTFFAVGAGHLAGKNGVLDLLNKEGYQLTPLSMSKG